MLMFDRLANFISGLGTSKDKTVANQYALTLITREELEAAYRSDWLARKIIDLPPQDMTREWRKWQAEEGQIEKIEDAERVLRVRDKVAAGLQRGRLYGGAAIYMGVRGQSPAEPLDVEKVSEGDLEYIHVLSRYEIRADDVILDPLSPNFSEPTFYEVQSRTVQARIHPSRVIRFLGSPLPEPLSQGDTWGDPTLQIVYDAIQQATSAAQHIAALIPEAKTDVIGVPGLSEHLSTKEGTSRITSRFRAAAQIKSMFNMLLIESGEGESGETWEQKKIEFGQFPELVRMYLQIASGAADIPVTRLLGQSPAGLNATGDSDIRNYYDGLASKQETELRPALDRLDEVLIRSALGSRPPEVYYEFAPLWQLSEKEKADIGKAEAETDQIYSNSALIPAPVLETAVRNRLIESGRYPGIEKAYEEFDSGTLEPIVEPEAEPDAPELLPGGNGAALRTPQGQQPGNN